MDHASRRSAGFRLVLVALPVLALADVPLRGVDGPVDLLVVLMVGVALGASGPVLVRAGEADFTSITRLDEALTAQASGQAVQLAIDAANLRYADSASMRRSRSGAGQRMRLTRSFG